VVRGYRRHEPHGRAEESDDCLAAGFETLNPVFRKEAANLVKDALGDEQILSQVNALFAPYGRVVGLADPPAIDATWSLSSPVAPDLSGWLASKGLKHTMRREGESRVYDLPKDSIKKKIAVRLRSQPTSDGTWVTEIVTAEKFSARDFLKTAVPGPERTYAEMRRDS